jgi:arylsulfatase A-like enzyme
MPHVPLHASEEFRGRSRWGPYGDAVEEIDWSTGRILAALERHGLEENTLVIFTSDNGPARRSKLRGGSAGPFRGGKGTTWEGGVRVPFLARWPGRIPPATQCHGIGTIMDLFPTLVELAGGALPRDRVIDGKDILGMLTGKERSPHEEFYYYSGARIFAVRWRNWKLHLRRRGSGALGLRRSQELKLPELYDLDEDPSESVNLAAGEPKLVSRLSALVQEFQAGVKPGTLPPRLPLRLR